MGRAVDDLQAAVRLTECLVVQRQQGQPAAAAAAAFAVGLELLRCSSAARAGAADGDGARSGVEPAVSASHGKKKGEKRKHGYFEATGARGPQGGSMLAGWTKKPRPPPVQSTAKRRQPAPVCIDLT